MGPYTSFQWEPKKTSNLEGIIFHIMKEIDANAI